MDSTSVSEGDNTNSASAGLGERKVSESSWTRIYINVMVVDCQTKTRMRVGVLESPRTLQTHHRPARYQSQRIPSAEATQLSLTDTPTATSEPTSIQIVRNQDRANIGKRSCSTQLSAASRSKQSCSTQYSAASRSKHSYSTHTRNNQAPAKITVDTHYSARTNKQKLQHIRTGKLTLP